MNDRIRMTTIFSVEAGGRETFIRAVDKACDMLRSDPGVLCFEWFMNEAGTTCMGWEEYRNSADLIRTHKELAGALTDVLKVAQIERHVILGEVTGEVREVMPTIVEYLGERHGFRR